MKAMEDAGLLTQSGEIPDPAYDAIIDGIVSIAETGMVGVPDGFACSYKTSITPRPGVFPKDIKNREKYPEFHNIVMKKYRETLIALNLESQFLAPFPFWHPVALGLKLGLSTPSVDLPSIDLGKFPSFNPAIMLNILRDLGIDIQLPDLVAKAPTFAGVSIPSLNANIPSLNPGFLEKFKFEFWQPALGDLFIDIATKLISPKFVVDLLSVPPNICPIVDSAAQKLPSPTNEGEVAKVAIDAHHTIYTAKLLPVAGAHVVIGRGAEIAEALGLKKQSPKLPGSKTISDNGIRILDYEEGYGNGGHGGKLLYFLDGAAVYGWGHLVATGVKDKDEMEKKFPKYAAKSNAKDQASKEFSFSIFKDDISKYETLAKKACADYNVELDKITQNQFDVLVSLVFNYGYVFPYKVWDKEKGTYVESKNRTYVPNTYAEYLGRGQFKEASDYLARFEKNANLKGTKAVHYVKRRTREAIISAAPEYDPSDKNALSFVPDYSVNGKLRESNGPIEEFLSWRNSSQKGYTDVPSETTKIPPELNTDPKTPPAKIPPPPAGYKYCPGSQITPAIRSESVSFLNSGAKYGQTKSVDKFVLRMEPHFDNHPKPNLPPYWHPGVSVFVKIEAA